MKISPASEIETFVSLLFSTVSSMPPMEFKRNDIITDDLYMDAIREYTHGQEAAVMAVLAHLLDRHFPSIFNVQKFPS